MWRDILLVALGIILGYGLGAFWCMCQEIHPLRKPPPLKEDW